ncbi:hypothetical protein [Litoribacillus peritrichatus]|uniref:Uncharacterized protein n=1 Tax=Litoribacillus peritrichatus TaxID=718191 RepID=A0ABP7MK18_9GAMM
MRYILLMVLTAVSLQARAHYPLLNCEFTENEQSATEQVFCDAGFSDGTKAPNVVMEVFSEDDETLVSGHTDATAKFQFDRPEGVFFIIMDAGPGHVIEISDEEVN